MAIASVKKLIWCVNCHQRKKMFCHNGQDGNNCKWKAYSVFSYLYSVNSSPQKKKKRIAISLPFLCHFIRTWQTEISSLTYSMYMQRVFGGKLSCSVRSSLALTILEITPLHRKSLNQLYFRSLAVFSLRAVCTIFYNVETDDKR